MAEITDLETDELEGTEGTEGEQSIGGDPEVDGPEVIVEDDDGEIDDLSPQTEEETIDGPQYCQGSFRMLTASCFTQNEDYSDDYLKSKGLFDLSDEVGEDEVVEDEV